MMRTEQQPARTKPPTGNDAVAWLVFIFALMAILGILMLAEGGEPGGAPAPAAGRAGAGGQPHRVSSAAGLNVREAPSTAAPILRRLPDHARVMVYERTPEGWGNIGDGWVSLAFLRRDQ